MDNNRLKIKIGDQEFEAEGPPEIVQAQFAAFRELVSIIPPRQSAKEQETGNQNKTNQPQKATTDGPLELSRIMKVEGRVVSLTVRPGSLEDALMLMLLGQKVFRNNDGVTGSEIVDGLRVSGQSKEGSGRVLQKVAEEGCVIITGTHRGKRYRLTNQGATKAQEIARAAIRSVA